MKTTRFKDPKYVGDPLNAVKIFNEKEVDELIVLDIDATVLGREPNFSLIEKLAAECRMPLCYGGGITSVVEAQRIFSLGVEKIALSSSAVINPALVKDISTRVGSQSVVVVLDVKRNFRGNKYELFLKNGKNPTGLDPVNFAREMQLKGAGEIVINSIDHDGMMAGYDTQLIDLLRSAITIPLTVMGGAGSLSDMGEIMQRHGIMGLAAGSLFVFKGKYKAVLINYPNADEKESIFAKHFAPYW